MRRLFGGKKKKQEVAPPVKKDPFDFTKHQAKLEGHTDGISAKLHKVEGEIKANYAKLKRTAINSEKRYIKQRLKQLLMKRKHLQGQLNRYTNQQMMIDKVAYNKETVDDTIEMAKYMKEANQVQKDAMKNFDMDEFQDNIDDMQELAYENDEIAELMNDQFDMDVDEDLDAELENLENELEVQEMMKDDNKDVQTNKY